MKRFPLIYLLLALALSCTKEQDFVPSVPEERVRVSFCAPAPSSKASGNDEVASVDFIAFDEITGAFETHERSEDGTRSVCAELPCTRRVRWSLVANAPKGVLDTIPSHDAFTKTVMLLADCNPRSVMASSGSGMYTEPATVPVTLNRALCRIELGSVTSRYTPGGNGPMRLLRVFLINVRSDLSYTMEADSAGLWLNRLAPDPDLGEKESELLCAQRDLSLPEDISVPVNAELYCLPNPVNNGVNSLTHPLWSPRNTRLVLEVKDDDETLYYPATLPALSSNTRYVIKNIVLIGPGSVDPDCPPGRDQIEFSVEVTPWTKTQVEAEFGE